MKLILKLIQELIIILFFSSIALAGIAFISAFELI